MSLLPSGSKIVITGGSFVQNNDATKVLTPLYDNVAPNAILNSGGRADTVRCHPGTREEVIGKIEKWIAVTQAQDRRLFWLSGPAGAGKSAIIQTVAERCIERKIPMASFFFFRADNTRNHSSPIVATLLFQLFKLFPALRAHVAAVATENPVIFRESMEEQFSALVEAPLLALRASSERSPLVILIDGLDECSQGGGNAEQISLLSVLHNITTRSNFPAFTVLVASRTEAHLTMAFNEIGCHPASIYLDESYRPSDDIRVFLIHEFSRIRRAHSLRNTLPVDWPPTSDLDAIVEKSSGQFVYSATVIHFIATSAASPKRSLEIVLGLRPVAKTSPFATLDSLYTYILSQAEDWASVQDILAAQNILSSWGSSSTSWSLAFALSPLAYTEDDILSSLSDLTAIVRFRAGDPLLTVYHASLNDFLYDPRRACDFYIDINAFACRLAPPHFRRMADRGDLERSFQILESVTDPDSQLTEFLTSFLPSPELFRFQVLPSYQRQYTRNIFASLYQLGDPKLTKYITDRWQEWFDIAHSLALEESSRVQTISVYQIPQNRTISEALNSMQAAPHTVSAKTPFRPSTPPSCCFPILGRRFTRRKNRNVETRLK